MTSAASLSRPRPGLGDRFSIFSRRMTLHPDPAPRPAAWWPIVPGSAPGQLQIDPDAPPPAITALGYSPEDHVEQPIERVAELEVFLPSWPSVWIDVVGLGDAEVLEQLGDLCGIHHLALEDVVNVGQRPKVESYKDRLFVVARAPATRRQRHIGQISIFLGSNFLITFQEDESEIFTHVRDRLHQKETLLREQPTDFLMYAVLDAVIDAFFPVVEDLRDRLEKLEERTLAEPDRGVVARILATKRRILDLRRAVWPLRDCVAKLQRDATDYVSENTAFYLRDCHDHALRLTELIEMQREQISDMMSIYLSAISNRMNEVMKVLTIIATIFIPLSFIAGLYGMNFNPERSVWNMPELNWAMGYPFALGIMAAVAVAMLILFRRKKWL